MISGAEKAERAGAVDFRAGPSYSEAMVREIEAFDYTKGPEFSEETHPAEITEDRMAWGYATDILYERGYKRLPPWRVVDGERIEYYGKIQLQPNEDPPTVKRKDDLRHYGVIPVQQITAEDLAREQGRLSPGVLKTVHVFKIVEDNLPYFIKQASDAFKDVKGLSRSYNQWGLEEAEHSNAAGLILQTVGGWTKEDVDRDYYVTQRNTWEPPFATDIEMDLYAMNQERNTRGNYGALAGVMREQGAPNCALVVTRIQSDEQYHGEGYRAYAEAYARISPERAVEAAKAALRVAHHFRMPSLHLMRDRMADTKQVIDTIGYNQEEIEKMLRSGLNDLSFVPKHLIDDVVGGYWKAESARVKKIIMEQLREKARERRSARLDGPQNGNGLVPA